MNNNYEFLNYDDYAQSANSLFHFMTKIEYLKTILIKKALFPRYCVENIEYLNLHRGELHFSKIAVLQKCFCDIPFHKLGESFPLVGVGEAFDSLTDKEKSELEKNNTHIDYYGSFGVAFPKWLGENMGLQPIHYANASSSYVKDYSQVYQGLFGVPDVPEEYVQDILNRLSFLKPLRGIMRRKTKHNNEDIYVDLYKNFHDEKEWRYVPAPSILKKHGMHVIIANPKLLPKSNIISDVITHDRYSDLWIHFSYEDHRYIIVPDAHSRI